MVGCPRNNKDVTSYGLAQSLMVQILVVDACVQMRDWKTERRRQRDVNSKDNKKNQSHNCNCKPHSTFHKR